MCHTGWVLETKIVSFPCCRVVFQLSCYIRRHDGALNLLKLNSTMQNAGSSSNCTKVLDFLCHSEGEEETDSGVSHNSIIPAIAQVSLSQYICLSKQGKG